MDNHPMGWLLLYQTPLGKICLYGKVMLFTRYVEGLGKSCILSWAGDSRFEMLFCNK